MAPTRRKRLRKELERKNDEMEPICNGHTDWTSDSAPEKPLPLPPTMTTEQLEKQEVYTAEEIMTTSEENIQKLGTRLQGENNMWSQHLYHQKEDLGLGELRVALDEDRTSHGAESLPRSLVMWRRIFHKMTLI